MLSRYDMLSTTRYESDISAVVVTLYDAMSNSFETGSCFVLIVVILCANVIPLTRIEQLADMYTSGSR